MMRWFMLGLTVLWLAGCDYETPLVTDPALDIDRALVGLWSKPGASGAAEHLLVLPLDPREALVVYPAGSPDAMFARATLWRRDDLTLMQLNWFGTARAALPKDRRTFQFAAFDLAGDTLTVRLLNRDAVKPAEASADGLAQAIRAGRGNPASYRDAMVFTRRQAPGAERDAP
ncbi:MAG: hypothetical protein GX590_07885 [Lentisphaerae bacterium]|nr:hypothetical protein [Lentisphaerota bacterium]